MKINYRLALDLGTNSIGWCVYRLSASEPDDQFTLESIQRMGVRIFSDGRDDKTKTSLAAARREARQARRRRDRMLKRKQRFFDQLVDFGLLPQLPQEQKALVNLDPYALRAKAMTEQLSPFEVGRALFHLARKRGFRSGRKDFAEANKDTGPIKEGIARLREQLQGQTLGQFLHARREKGLPVLARPTTVGTKTQYAFYLDRQIIADEFDAIWAQQARFNPAIFNADAHARLRDTMLFQRPLRPVEPGTCLYERSEKRALLAHPLSQRFRILQELANLRIKLNAHDERALTKAERDQLLHILRFDQAGQCKGRELTWAEVKKKLSLPRSVSFNLDISGRKGLKCDAVSIALRQESAVGAQWDTWSTDQQAQFLQKLRRADRVEDLATSLIELRLNSEKHAVLMQIAARMPDDFGAIGLTALQKIVPELDKDVLTYNQAVINAGYRSHSDFSDGLWFEKLPYYGERLAHYTHPMPTASNEAEKAHGRIANPTVHVALNQLRRVVNAIMKRFGHPSEVIIEVARELGLSGERRKELEKELKENRAANEALERELQNIGVKASRENRLRLRLFNEVKKIDPLGVCCIYTGKPISVSMLFSNAVHIDHILPFSKSLDDGYGNKLLCIKQANADKADKTPFDAFANHPQYDWPEILDRVEKLIPKKAKKFKADALQLFLGDRQFLDRHLTDTAYFSRVAREYLCCICPPNKVWVSTGRLTAMLRGKWGLNQILSDSGKKNRTDHRHHAVDAAVIGACDRALIQKMATAARHAEAEGEYRLFDTMAPPWQAFFEDVKTKALRIVVSHKPDHGIGGALHNDTAYGQISPPGKDGRSLVVTRKPITAIKTLDQVDALLLNDSRKQQLRDLIEMTPQTQLAAAITGFSARTGIHRVRITEKLTVQPIFNPHRAEPKFVKTDGNYCYDIFVGAKGKWDGRVISRLEANKNQGKNLELIKQAYGDAFRMRLRIDDTIRMKRDGEFRLYRVVGVTDGTVTCCQIFEAGNLRDRDRNEAEGFKYTRVGPTSLQSSEARVVGINELGFVNDAGFKP